MGMEGGVFSHRCYRVPKRCKVWVPEALETWKTGLVWFKCFLFSPSCRKSSVGPRVKTADQAKKERVRPVGLGRGCRVRFPCLVSDDGRAVRLSGWDARTLFANFAGA